MNTMTRAMVVCATMAMGAMVQARDNATMSLSEAQPEGERGGGGNMLVVYDVRDLASMLSPEGGTGGGGVPVLKDIPLVSNLFATRRGEGGGTPAADGTRRGVIDSLAEASSMVVQTITPGILAATGTKDQHELFQRLINQLRTVDSGTYEVEIAVSKAGPDQSAAIGQPFASSGEAVRVKQAVRGRTAASLHATETTSYISDWVPVVGNSAVAYQPQTKEAVSGLQLGVLVTPSSAGRVDVRLTGSLDKADVRMTPNPATGTGAAGQPVPSDLGIGLPTVQSRSIAAELDLPLDQSTVVAVVAGFGSEGREQVVVAVKVRQLRPPGTPQTPPAYPGLLPGSGAGGPSRP